MMGKKISLSSKELIYFFAFLAYYIPPAYALPEVLHSMWVYFMVFVSIAGVFVNLWSVFKTKRDAKLYFIFLIFITWSYIGTNFFSDTSIFNLRNYIRNIGFVSVMDYCFSKKKIKPVLRSYVAAGVLMTLLNYISFLIYKDIPGGMKHGQYVLRGLKRGKTIVQHYFLLSYDNDTIYYYLTVGCILFFYSYYMQKKISKFVILYNVLVLYMYISLEASTAIVAYIVMVIGEIYYLFYKGKVDTVFTYKRAYIWGCGVEVLAVIIVGGEFALKISNFFGKRVVFSGRGRIWSNSLKHILNHFIAGNGIQTVENNFYLIGQTHCHNFLLEVLYVAGITGILLLLFIFIYSRPLEKKCKSNSFFAFTIFAYFLAGSMDWLYENPVHFAVFFFVHYLSSVITEPDNAYTVRGLQRSLL